MPKYTVKSGDTLSGIASKLGLGSYNKLQGWQGGYGGSNPNLIQVGEVFSYGGGGGSKKSSGGSKNKVSGSLGKFANKFEADQAALLKRQKQEQSGYFDQYQDAINNQTGLPEIYTGLQEELGVNELGQQMQGFKDEIFRVKGLLDTLDEDVSNRTVGTYTNQAMRNRIEATESEDLRNQLGRLGTGMQPVADLMTGAQNQIATLLPLTVQQQQKELQPLEMKINALSDRFAREITGFNKARENQLTAVLDKLERKRQLDDREWQLAQELAAEEREFTRQKELAKIKASGSGGGGGGGFGQYLPQRNNTPIPQPQQTANSIFNSAIFEPKQSFLDKTVSTIGGWLGF